MAYIMTYFGYSWNRCT